MLRSGRLLCVGALVGLTSCVLFGCFGKVAYDEAPIVGTGALVGEGGSPPSDTPSTSSGGIGGSEHPSLPLDPLEPPPTEPQTCVVDCCPERLSQLVVSANGAPLDASVDRAYISLDGTWITFSTRATNLALASASGFREVYLHSLISQRTLRVRPGGDVPPSADGDVNAMSADGRWVLLTSWANNWASSDQNEATDVFLFDRVSGELELVSRANLGGTGNASSLGRDLSPDGRYVVYSSAASDLVLGDDNSGWDVFVWDRTVGVTRRVSMGPGDQQVNPVAGNHAHISADGRYVSFHSQSDLLVPGGNTRTFDVFLADLVLGTTTKISRAEGGGEADGNTFVLGMSDDARFLSSYGSASNLVGLDTNGQTDVFLFDRLLGSTKRVNVGPAGQQAATGSTSVSMSHDGKHLGFASSASELLGDGVNLQSFVHRTETGELLRVSQNALGQAGNGHSYAAEVSGSGRCFVMTSNATNLVGSGPIDEVTDLFVGPLPAGP